MLAGTYNAKSPKQDSKNINSVTKTIHFAHLCILLVLFSERKYLNVLETGIQERKDYLPRHPNIKTSKFKLFYSEKQQTGISCIRNIYDVKQVSIVKK